MQAGYQAGRETDEPNKVPCFKQLHTPVVLPLGKNRPVTNIQGAIKKWVKFPKIICVDAVHPYILHISCL